MADVYKLKIGRKVCDIDDRCFISAPKGAEELKSCYNITLRRKNNDGIAAIEFTVSFSKFKELIKNGVIEFCCDFIDGITGKPTGFCRWNFNMQKLAENEYVVDYIPLYLYSVEKKGGEYKLLKNVIQATKSAKGYVYSRGTCSKTRVDDSDIGRAKTGYYATSYRMDDNPYVYLLAENDDGAKKLLTDAVNENFDRIHDTYRTQVETYRHILGALGEEADIA